MSDETLYFTALTRLSTYTSGASDFEKICRIVAKFMCRDYNFKTPEGGRGTQDGGYDGYDPTKKAKLACSIQKDYGKKIQEEIEKSKHNDDSKLFYFSNQIISEPSIKELNAKYSHTGIGLIIYGIDAISNKIDEYFKNHNNPELYDLLGLSFLRVGELYRRGDAIRLDINFNGNIYKKRIHCLNENSNIIRPISENFLLDRILSYCSEGREYSFKHITLCGIAYIGKSLLMEITYNTLIDEFSDETNYYKYKFIPFVHFYKLKYYDYGEIRTIIKNKIDPIFIFLDGLDELNVSKQIALNNEIQNILRDNDCVRIVIAGRNSSFMNIEISSKSIQFCVEKSYDTNDSELISLMVKYKDTPIADLLPIPMYRNFVLKNKINEHTKLDEFYDILVRDNLKKDNEKNDYSNNISPRMISAINVDTLIKEISDFCYILFENQKIVFSENDLQMYFDNDKFLFLIKSSIIDYHDKTNVSFVSIFYYEYFVASKLSTMGEKIAIQSLFVRGKVNVTRIEILTLFLNYTKTTSTRLYNIVNKKLLKGNIEYILISEFDSILDDKRYEYFKSLLNKYNNEGRFIYYVQFRQIYGPLKNIDNLAQRMQQLLPNSHKLKAVTFLKSEIDSFLQRPSKENIWSFANAVILLNPYIDDLWSEEEQAVLRELSLPLIRFFIYDDISKEIKGLLSERFALDWHNRFNWTIDWELLYKNISGNAYDLLSEIADDREYYLKFNILVCSQNGNTVNPLFFPIIRYALKNKYLYGNEMASYAPSMIADDYETPMTEVDSQNYELLHLVKNVKLNLSEILNLLVFAMNNNLYRHSYNNPITILEEKLYNDIVLITHKDYEKFSQYYFNIKRFGLDDKLFQVDQTKEIENLKKFLLGKVIDKKTNESGIWYFICNLISSTNVDFSLELLHKIKEGLPYTTYKDVVRTIYNTKNHNLRRDSLFIDEFNRLFPQEIEKAKHLENVKKEIEIVKNNDFILMQNTEMMIDELRKVSDFILNIKTIGNNDINFYNLCHNYIIDTISYIDENYNPPIFSECAINIIKQFHQQKIYDIEVIIKKLQEYFFKEENFYLYFYWVFIDTLDNTDSVSVRDKIKTYPDLVQKIINGMNNDVSERINKPLEYLEISDNRWLAPFLYYYKILLTNNPPLWMHLEHILKLIIISCRYSNIDTSSMNLLYENFPQITPRLIVEYGLKKINNVKTYFSKTTIITSFIDYYKVNVQDALTKEILNYFINTTKMVFESSLDDVPMEYQDISLFWAQCNSNHIDCLFPNFTIETITSTIRKNGYGSQFRKNVLLYCNKHATYEQKYRIIHEIETDLAKKKCSPEENEEIHRFLASIGSEKSIRYIINLYLSGKEVCNSFVNDYTLGFMKQSTRLLNDFITLFIYCSEKDNERRRLLQNIAQKGISEHLNEKNFESFERRLLKKIKSFHKEKRYWLSEYYNEYLLQMEQLVFLKTESVSKSA
jgi:hypothetical protein